MTLLWDDDVRNAGAPSPELLPVGYLVGDVNRISVNLRRTSRASA